MLSRINASHRGLTAAALVFFASSFQSGSLLAATSDPVIMTFSTVGDSRQDPIAPDATTLPLSGQDAKWLQNTKAWSRIMRSIQAQKSNFLFFNGDMIMGYGNAIAPTDTTLNGILNSDLVAFYKQYGYWRGMVSGMMETGTYVVPVPGNHEVQCKACGKKAQLANENAWKDNMGDLILDTTRLNNLFPDWSTASYVDPNHPGVSDGITTDQSKLSYSFDYRGTHFTVINTDAVGKDGFAPVNWLAADLAAAQARGAQHYYVFGHKPAYTYFYQGSDPAKPSGFDANPVNRDAFWNLMEQYGATYFCGHEHIFNMTQPRASTGGSAWQVIVGAGGSPFDTAVATSTPTDRMYSWATVKIHQSGQVDINAYGFDDHLGPTVTIQSATLPH